MGASVGAGLRTEAGILSLGHRKQGLCGRKLQREQRGTEDGNSRQIGGEGWESGKSRTSGRWES